MKQFRAVATTREEIWERALSKAYVACLPAEEQAALVEESRGSIARHEAAGKVLVARAAVVPPAQPVAVPVAHAAAREPRVRVGLRVPCSAAAQRGDFLSK